MASYRDYKDLFRRGGGVLWTSSPTVFISWFSTASTDGLRTSCSKASLLAVAGYRGTVQFVLQSHQLCPCKSDIIVLLYLLNGWYSAVVRQLVVTSKLLEAIHISRDTNWAHPGLPLREKIRENCTPLPFPSLYCVIWYRNRTRYIQGSEGRGQLLLEVQQGIFYKQTCIFSNAFLEGTNI